jgi:hypothetical protein
VAGDDAESATSDFIDGGGGEDVGSSSFLISDDMSNPRKGLCSLAVREMAAG